MIEDGHRPFDCSIETLKRINQLLIDLQEMRVMFRLVGYKGNLYELYKEAWPFLCESEIHLKHEMDSDHKDMQKHLKDGCPRQVAQQKWDEIETYAIETDNQGRVTAYHDETVDAMDSFDFWLRDFLKREGLTYRKRGDDPGSAIFKGTN